MAAADSQIAILDDDGKCLSGDMPSLGFAAQSSDRSEDLKLIHVPLFDPIHFGQVVQGLVRQARHSLSEGNRSLALRYFQLAFNEISKSKSSSKYGEQLEEISGEIKRLKTDQKAIDDAASEVNQKLAESLTKKKEGDGDSFDMRQIN